MKTLTLQILGLVFNLFLVFIIISYSNLNKFRGGEFDEGVELREIIRYILINSNAGFSSLDNLKNFIKISHQALLNYYCRSCVRRFFISNKKIV